MKKSRICALGAAAAIGAALSTTGASAAMAATPNPDTLVTFTVTNGELTIDAPLGVTLTPDTEAGDSGLPGTSVAGTMGTTTVTDNRAALLTPWIASVSSTDFLTGTGTGDETIPAGAAGYDPGPITVVSGNVTASGTAVTALSGDPQQVVTDAGSGDNVATWDATISLLIPATAVVGTYTGTLTSSVG
jgi:hypothetical protein